MWRSNYKDPKVKTKADVFYLAPELCSRDVLDFPRLRVLPGPDVGAAGCLLHISRLGAPPLEERVSDLGLRRDRLEQRGNRVNV